MAYIARTRIEYVRKGQVGFSATYFGPAGETLADLVYLLGDDVIITKYEILDAEDVRV